MKVTCTKDNLKKALSAGTKIISSTTSLPVLNNVLLKTDAGQLQISSTNLEIAIKTWVGAQIDEPGEITVPAKTFSEFVNNIQEEKVELKTDKTDLQIDTKSTKAVLKGLPAEDFPLIPQIEAPITIKTSSKELSEALASVVFSTSFSETQPELSGVLFYIQEKKLKLVATDRYRLAERTINLEQPTNENKIIVPGRAVSELIRILNDNSGDVDIYISENQVLFKTDQTELISRVIEGQYPDYEQILPKEHTTSATVKREEFSSAVKLAGLFAQDTNNIEIEVSPEEKALVLKSASQRSGSNISRAAAIVSGEKNTIVFNYKYIIDCLSHLSDKEVVLRLVGSGSPATITPKDREDYLYLVMPIKV